jgi:formylmethanofuran dehydrogenase subunit E
MRRGIASILAVALVSSLGLAAGVYAQATKDEKTKLDRIDGTVMDVNKDKSEISVKQSKTTNTTWIIVYTPDTKFTYRNVAANIDEVQKTRHVICLGTFSSDKARMTAARIDVRSGK